VAGNSKGSATGGIKRLILLKRPPPVAVEIENYLRLRLKPPLGHFLDFIKFGYL
jgi:hypothetical protein